MPKLVKLLCLLLALGLPTLAVAGELRSTAGYKTIDVKTDFETALFDLSDAIVNRGLVVDYTGHVGKMLERTSGATGGKSPYLGARYLQFCSAKLSQAAMQADPDNLAICPYVVFAYELKSKPGTTRVGYRRPIAGQSPASREAIAAVEKLLDDIIGEAGQ